MKTVNLEILSIIIKNVGILLVTGAVGYFTLEPLSLLGLLALGSWKPDKCPKCGYEFNE